MHHQGTEGSVEWIGSRPRLERRGIPVHDAIEQDMAISADKGAQNCARQRNDCTDVAVFPKWSRGPGTPGADAELTQGTSEQDTEHGNQGCAEISMKEPVPGIDSFYHAVSSFTVCDYLSEAKYREAKVFRCHYFQGGAGSKVESCKWHDGMRQEIYSNSKVS